MNCPNCDETMDSVIAVRTLEATLVLSVEDGVLEGRCLGEQRIGHTEVYLCPLCQVEIDMPDDFEEID